jgi:hypothetical protein
MKDHDGLRWISRRAAAILISVSVGICLALGLLLVPAGASAASVTAVGEGFPLSMNSSDHILVGKLGFEEDEGVLEETLEGPWSIWAAGKSTRLEPLNGEPNGEPESLDHEHKLELDNINEAGQVGGSSTVASVVGSETKSLYRAVSITPTGTATEVPLFQEELERENSKEELESYRVGSLGTGIDNAGDVVGIGAEEAKIDGKPRAVGRAFFAPAGGNPQVVGEADAPASGPWISEVYEVNGSGTMFGSVSPVEEDEQPTSTKYYLWKSPSEMGTELDFDTPVRGLASDGSILGEKAGVLYLRTPDGKETAITGLSNPFSVNASHQVAGSETVKGAEHAAVWQNGTVTDLNSELPANSGWVLQRASVITDGGDIAGIGTFENRTQIFLLKPGLVVTSSKDTKESSSAGPGVCATDDGCTLRAAIETADGANDAAQTRISFNISGVTEGAPATISPATPLPPITAPVYIDASTQPHPFKAGSRTIGAIVDGAAAGTEASGLKLEEGAAGSTVVGLQIQHFGGDGVLLAGESQQLADSVLTSDSSGAEVASNHDTVGSGNGLTGDVFFLDGKTGVAEYLKGLAAQHISSEQLEVGLDVFGGGVVLAKPSSGTAIAGDFIGVHGPGFSEAPDKLAGDGLGSFNFAASGFPIGVLIAPGGAGAINGVTIGGAGEAADVDSGTVFGVMAIAAEGSSINGLAILGSSFGAGTDGSALQPLGGLFGVFAAGTVNGLEVGAPGVGDSFGGLVSGIVLAGEHVSSPVVQSDTFGTSSPIGEAKDGFGLHNVFGLMLADAQGARIGGTAAGQGNNFPGSIVGLAMNGKHLANDTITGNTIGTAPSSPFTTFLKAPEEYSTVLGILGGDLLAGPGGENVAAQNLTLQNNKIQGTVMGLFNQNINGLSMTGNTIENNAIGMLDSGSGGERIGGSGAGEGNSFLNDGIGLLDVSEDPSAAEVEKAQLNSKDTSASTRQGYLSEPDENLAFAGVDSITTAELGESSANTSSAPGTNNTILGNRFGVDAAGNPHPDEVPVLIGGDEHGLQFGGIAAGQGNVVEDNRDSGLVIAGKGAHAPTVQILGNTIYNNENFTGSLTGFPGLGIDLAYNDETAVVGRLGVNPQDPTQPDLGTNNLQNAPVLTSAVASAGQLTISGSLHGVASTNYLLEVFADENQNPFGAGEGQTLLERISVPADAAGNVSFTTTVAAPSAGYRYVSSTATTVPASGPGVTSEFSVNAPIASSAPPPAPAPTPSPTPSPGAPSPGATTGGATTPTPKGATTTTLSSGGGSATVSGSSVTLPVQVSCSSATSSPCTVTTTASVPASSAGKASATATATSAAAKHRKSKQPVTLGHATTTLAPGASSPLHLTLNSHGLALLRSDHTLAITLVVTIAGPGRATVTRTLHIRLKYKKPAKAKSKHR